MHQWTVLHMVSINSGNVEISWGGWGKLSNHAYGFCVTMTEVHYTIAAMQLTPCCGF